jgi:hypothetical protein
MTRNMKPSVFALLYGIKNPEKEFYLVVSLATSVRIRKSGAHPDHVGEVFRQPDNLPYCFRFSFLSDRYRDT